MAYKYHVTLSEHQKCGIEVCSKNELKNEVIRKLKLNCSDNDLVLQCWNPEWDEFENVDNLEELPDKAKIRVFIQGNSTEKIENLKSTCNEMDTENGDAMSMSSDTSSGGATCSTAEAADNSNQNHTKQPVKQDLWPVKFIVPKRNFGLNLTESLRQKRPIVGRLLTKLTESIYEEVMKYTFYPTSAQYREVAEALIHEYPYLAEDIPGSDAVSTWKQAIAYRFRNNRKRKDRDVMRPRKRVCAEVLQETKSTSAGKSNQWGVQNFLPERPNEEDDSSIKRHISWIQDQSKRLRGCQDKDTVQLLMRQTFADRRKLIICEGANLTLIKENYPFLFSTDEIKREFCRLTNVNIDLEISDGMDKFSEVVFKIARSTAMKSNLVERIKLQKDTESISKMTAIGVFMLIAQELKETTSLLFSNDVEVKNSTHPIIIFDREWHGMDKICVASEGEQLCDCDDMSEAVACLVAAYYTFNIAYPPKLVRTLTFIQKILMNIQDKVTTPRLVSELARKLNSCTSL